MAAACRGMKNMGLGRLLLVDPPRELDHPEARALAYGAWDVLDGAARVASLAEAVAGSTLVVGLSARAGPGAWTPRQLASEGAAAAGGGRVSLVFGPEATGLRNDELALCHRLVRIPSHAAQPSLNLAQAVLLVAYEVRLSAELEAVPDAAPRASAGELEAALAALREALLAVGYLNPDNPDALLAELRTLLARAGPTPREISLLRGLARQVLWAAGRIAAGGGGSG